VSGSTGDLEKRHELDRNDTNLWDIFATLGQMLKEGQISQMTENVHV